MTWFFLSFHYMPSCAVFCFAIWCSYCASYANRRKALDGDMKRYICCNGDWPCSGKMKEKSCPEFCLCMEVVLFLTFLHQTNKIPALFAASLHGQSTQRIPDSRSLLSLNEVLQHCKLLDCFCHFSRYPTALQSSRVSSPRMISHARTRAHN